MSQNNKVLGSGSYKRHKPYHLYHFSEKQHLCLIKPKSTFYIKTCIFCC